MRVLVQRVKSSSVVAEGATIAEIKKGLLLLVGVGKEDSREDAAYLARKIASLRIFEDKDGKMNLNIKDAGGEALSVSQFTLFADTKKGNRPGFDDAGDPKTSKGLWEELNGLLEEQGVKIARGSFGAKMEVSLVNDGPVTIWLDSKR